MWWLLIDWFDLPKLVTLFLGKASFADTNNLTMLGIPLIFSSKDVPFSHGQFSVSTEKNDWREYYIFQCITSSSITSDSSCLKNCIRNEDLDEHIVAHLRRCLWYQFLCLCLWFRSICNFHIKHFHHKYIWIWKSYRKEIGVVLRISKRITKASIQVRSLYHYLLVQNRNSFPSEIKGDEYSRFYRLE